ncbi:MAG: hypothetical protein Q4B29_00935 [Candidatus Saccharibacteria bacterium]|nr:hypothetical protein [Candidatus Saccharibacteria bacterium]
MDPSNNNAFNGLSQGDFDAGLSSGQAPITSGGSAAEQAPIVSGDPAAPFSQPTVPSLQSAPISSGTGDIVLTPSGGRKSRKGLIAGIILALILGVGGVVGALFGTGVLKFGESEGKKNQAFYEVLVEHRDGVVVLSTLMDGFLNGKLSMQSFMMSESEYTESIQELSDAILDLEAINQRVQEGPVLSGIIAGIDLGASYEGLKESLFRDLGNYKTFANITIKIYEVFESKGEKKAVELLAEYEKMYSLAVYIDDYFEMRDEASLNYEQNNCANVSSAACIDLESVAEKANKEFMKNKIILKDSYSAAFDGFQYSGEGSVTWYLDELYVAVGGENEE